MNVGRRGERVELDVYPCQRLLVVVLTLSRFA
jgi:hypothetical protein